MLAVVIAPSTLINALLGVVMFGMGLATKLEDFKVVFRRPKDIAIGCAAQFTIMPALAWALARLFGLDMVFKSETLAGDEVRVESVETAPGDFIHRVYAPDGRDHVLARTA